MMLNRFTTYRSDDIGQLISESRTAYSGSYTYDANGNRLTRTGGGVTENYAYDDADKLQDVKIGGVTQKSYGYDTAGRTTSVVSSAGTTTLAYDYEGRISTITYPSTATNTFTYNGLDTRVSKVDSAGTATYKRDGAGVTAPVLSDASAVYTPGISERRSSTTTYLHSGLKNADSQSGTGQTIAATKQYDAFGNVLSSTGTWKGPFGYAGSFGYQEDADSSLKLLGHRYYDPSTGRFLTRDPIKDGRNWYVYCDSEPLAWLDSPGLGKGRAWRKVLEWTRDGASRISPGQNITRGRAERIRRNGGSVIAPSRREARDLDNSISGGRSFHDGPHGERHDGTPNVKPMPHYQHNGRRGHTFYRNGTADLPTLLLVLRFVGEAVDPTFLQDALEAGEEFGNEVVDPWVNEKRNEREQGLRWWLEE